MNKVSVRGIQLYFKLVSGAVFSFAYAVHSDYSGAMSNPVALGTFELQTEQPLSFDCKFHRQLQKNILAKAIND